MVDWKIVSVGFSSLLLGVMFTLAFLMWVGLQDGSQAQESLTREYLCSEECYAQGFDYYAYFDGECECYSKENAITP